MANINITTEELEKVLKGTGINSRYFLGKLSSIKMDTYKSQKEKQLERKDKQRSLEPT